jgi:hypothetical protein
MIKLYNPKTTIVDITNQNIMINFLYFVKLSFK